MAFQEFSKIGRLSRDVIVTEKIDGTNSHVLIVEAGSAQEDAPWLTTINGVAIAAASRNRYLTTHEDNFGFALWVLTHAEELSTLGVGRHYGEWWGSGVQRGYGLPKGEKRWSLFNLTRWALHGTEPQPIKTLDPRPETWKMQDVLPECVGLVPVVYRGTFDSFMGHSEDVMQNLQSGGSVAAPGFMNPEGIVIFHSGSGTLFKKTFEKDDEPKSRRA